MNKRIKIQALDTLFFKDARPFDMGDDSWAQGMFPPPPSVIYGALRAAYLNQWPEVKPDTEEDDTKDLRITAIYLEYNDTLYLPAPKDYPQPKFLSDDPTDNKILKEREEDDNKYRVIKPQLKKQGELGLSHSEMDFVPYLEQEVEAFNGGYTSQTEINQYLTREVSPIYVKSTKKIAYSEPKTGIGRKNETRATDEGKLFHLNMMRPAEKLFFVIEYEIPDDLQNTDLHILKLGAENKAAKVLNRDKGFQPKNWDISGNFFKVYLQTPTFFKEGYRPDLNQFLPKGHTVKLLTAFTGKAQEIGGFDIANKSPKPLLKAVPAGSVYYYEVTEGDIHQVLEALAMQKAINSFDNEKHPELLTDAFIEQKEKEGFGKFLLGKLTM